MFDTMMEIVFLDTVEGKNVVNELLKKKFIILVGSAVSTFKPILSGDGVINTSLPSGEEVKKSMYSYFFSSEPLSSEISSYLEKQWEKVVFENLMGNCPDEPKLRRIIKKTFGKAKPNLLHKYMADSFNQEIISGIITTNYDTCLDEELRRFDVQKVVTKQNFDEANILKDNIYFKIHGSVANEDDIDGETLVFALHHEGLLKEWKRELLHRMLGEESLLIVGYSGLDFEICPELLEIPIKNVYWNARGKTIEEVKNKLSFNARQFLEQKKGYFIVGDMKHLLLYIKNNSTIITEEEKSIILERGNSDELSEEIQKTFTEDELNIWKASILNAMGCASLAYKVSKEQVKKEVHTEQAKKIKLNLAMSLYDLGKYKTAAKEYCSILDNYNLDDSEKISILSEAANCYKVYGSLKYYYMNSKIKTISNNKNSTAWNEIRYLRYIFFIAEFLHISPLKNLIKNKVIELYSIAGENSIKKGNFMGWQQSRHWIERMGIDPQIIKKTLPYAPPSNEYGYDRIASAVGKSMFCRDMVKKTHDPIPETVKDEFKETIKRNVVYELYPELWKLCVIDLRRNICNNRYMSICLLFHSYRKCEYSIIMKILSILHAFFHLYRKK